jgi:hypothetical protein
MPQYVALVDGMKLELSQGLPVPRELVEIVPPHCVHVCETYLTGEDRLVFV